MQVRGTIKNNPPHALCVFGIQDHVYAAALLGARAPKELGWAIDRDNCCRAWTDMQGPEIHRRGRWRPKLWVDGITDSIDCGCENVVLR
jgi:hypothetical protein